VPRDLEIAVVDDDDSFRTALVESLSSLGYGADGYSSAEDYLGSIGGKSFHCLVTDIHMTGMSGFDLIERLAAQGSTTPVVLITARSDPNLTIKAAASTVCLLRKPFEIDALVGCIERAVTKS
jgi:FixJ family two-component response regulator